MRVKKIVYIIFRKAILFDSGRTLLLTEINKPMSISEIKLHIIVDILSLPHAIHVTYANMTCKSSSNNPNTVERKNFKGSS